MPYRVWRNLGGFNSIREYRDVVDAGTSSGGTFGDHRLVAVSVHKLHDMGDLTKQPGVKKIKEF